MNYKELGNTNISVSEISFGTVALGLPYGIDVKSEADMPDQAQAVRLLQSALDRGITFFDTALAYGSSEMLLGEAFDDRREEVVICTKPVHLYENGKLPDAQTIQNRLDECLQTSLKQLRTDYLDVWMSHDGTEEVIEHETMVDFFQSLKQRGVIRATGISVYTPAQAVKAIRAGTWDVIQLQLNLMDQRQLPAIETAATQGVGIVIRSVLCKGILTPRGEKLHPALRSVQEHRQAYNEIMGRTGYTLAELASRFVLSCPGVSSMLIGIDKEEYLEEALALADGDYLDEATVGQLKSLGYPDPDFLDLPAWDRKGWL